LGHILREARALNGGGTAESADAAEAQLSLIREVVGLLHTGRVPCWLHGGWGVDFLLGTVSRPHDDIEFVVWERDRERLKKLLRARGFEVIRDRPEDVISTKHGHLVEFYFIRRKEGGELVTPGKWEHWPWPEGAFSEESGQLGDVTCRVVGAEAQLDSKEGYLAHNGKPLRPKDVQDIRLLREILARRTGKRDAGGSARQGFD
jgi:aminoglycoside-2''-adenylyltransferase